MFILCASGANAPATSLLGTNGLPPDAALRMVGPMPAATVPSNVGALSANSTGRLTINGILSELGDTPAGSGYDQVLVAGRLTLGGTLDISLLNGFTPTLGQKFFILDSTAQELVSDLFSNVTAGAVPSLGLLTDGNLTYLVNYADHDPNDFSNPLRNDVSLTVVNPVPEPGTWALLARRGRCGRVGPGLPTPGPGTPWPPSTLSQRPGAAGSRARAGELTKPATLAVTWGGLTSQGGTRPFYWLCDPAPGRLNASHGCAHYLGPDKAAGSSARAGG